MFEQKGKLSSTKYCSENVVSLRRRRYIVYVLTVDSAIGVAVAVCSQLISPEARLCSVMTD